jgi:hypothetical protein
VTDRPPLLLNSEVPNWMIKYCSSLNYKLQAESLAITMKELGFNIVIEKGETGQFELFTRSWVQFEIFVDMWSSFMKEGPGIPKFFTLDDVKLKLSRYSTTEK